MNELIDGTVGSVDAATGVEIGPYRKFRLGRHTMAESTGKNPGAAEHTTDDRFELKKREALASLLDESVRFVKIDGDINDLLKQLLSAVVEQVKKDPGAAFSGKGDFDALVSALKARSEGGTGVSGGDIVGDSLISDLIDLIKALVGILKDEKDFFLKIIMLIFCGCK